MRVYRLELHNGHDWSVQYFRRLDVARRQFTKACATFQDVYLDEWTIPQGRLGLVLALNSATDSRYNIDGLREVSRKAGSF